MKEKQKWASERPKLENARTLRGIYFIDPEDKEFAEYIKNARKKLELPTAPAMPFKRTKSRNGVTCYPKDDDKSRLTCKLEADETKRLRMEGIEPRIHEDHTAGKGDNSLHHYSFGAQLYSHASSNEKYRQQKKQWTKNGELEKISAWNLVKVRNKSEVIEEARTKGVKVHIASLMDICHLKNAELEKKHYGRRGKRTHFYGKFSNCWLLR